MLKLQCEETGSWLANGAPVNSYGRKAFRYVFIQTYTVHTSRICQPIRYVSPASHRIPEDMQNVVMSSIFIIIRHTGVRRLLTSVCPLNSVSQPTYVQEDMSMCLLCSESQDIQEGMSICLLYSVSYDIQEDKSECPLHSESHDICTGGSVAEPSHFSSAPAPDIFFSGPAPSKQFRFRLRLHL